MTNEIIIDLEEYRSPGSRVFTGRDRGRDVREKSKFNELLVSGASARIIVPKDIRSINPSFLEEFLRGVVRSLGKDEFYRRVTFEMDGPYGIDEDLEEAVDRILRSSTALDI